MGTRLICNALCAFVVVCCLPTAFAAPLTPAEFRTQALGAALRAADRTSQSLAAPPPTLSSRELFMAALAYCEGRTNLDRIARLFEVAATMQDRNSSSTNRSYGNFRWSWSHEGVFDFNAVDFSMQTASIIWIKHRDLLPNDARLKLRELIRLGLEGLRRHRVSEHYTNIALMNAGNLILLGEAFNDPSAVKEGESRLDLFLLAMWEAGTHEYNSPTYYGIDLDDLCLIEAFARSDRARTQARALLRYFWTDIALNWFPAAQKMAGTRSRDYDYLRGLGTLDQHLLLAGWISPNPGKLAPGSLVASYAQWLPGPEFQEMATGEKNFPRYIQQIWGLESAHGRAHYLGKDITLSTSGAGYGGRMDLPLTIDLPGPRERTRGYFIPDGRQDPYGKIKISESRAHSKTLHLNPFWAGVQSTNDALGVVVYRPTDLNPTNTTLESHFVLPLDLEEIRIGERQVHFKRGERAEISVPDQQALTFRQGTAVGGIRVLWARQWDAASASTFLVNDANDFGAIRLTIRHHTSSVSDQVTNAAAAALAVRIGSGVGVGGYESWRKAFISSKASVTATGSSVKVSYRGETGQLAIEAAAPFKTPALLQPAYPRLLLARNGENIGRKILAGLEPIRSFNTLRQQPITVSTAGTSWEAEKAAILPPMVLARDSATGAGQFLWMPAAPGEKASSNLGRALYYLKVEKAGTYHLSGLVHAPTPQNDSFFLRIVRNEKVLLEQTTWALGTRKTWTWVTANDDSGQPLALDLPAGDITLEIRVREAGSKLRQLKLLPAR